MRHALEVFFEENRKEGMEKRTIEIARNLIAKDKMTAEEIAEATGLLIDDVLKLQGEM